MSRHLPNLILRLCQVLGILSLIVAPLPVSGDFEDIIREPETELAIDVAMREGSPRIVETLNASVTRVVQSMSDPDRQVVVVDHYLALAEKLDEAMNQPDPEDALRDSLIILRQAEVSLQSPTSIEALGEARHELIEGIINARSRIIGFARWNLTREQFARLQSTVITEEATRRRVDPGHRGFFRLGSRVQSQEARGYLASLASAPGRAVRAVPGSEQAEGALSQTFGFIGDAARFSGRAVGEVTGGVGTATGLSGIEHLSVTLRQLPTDLRENTTQILGDESYQATLQAIEGLTASTGQIAEAVERLPEEIRVTIDKFDQSQPQLRETIKESDIAIRNLESVLTQAEKASQALESTFLAAREAVQVTTKFIPEPREEFEETSEPFRMERVTEAAVALESTFVELRESINALHELVNEPRIPELASSAVQKSKGLVDYITIRALLLVAGILIMLLLYHIARYFLMRALARRNPPDGVPGVSA